eukprot:m51a1_g10391 hypothetical protein (737) ;mRNA; f:49538-54525
MFMPEVPEVFTISWAKRSFLKQFKVQTTYLNSVGGSQPRYMVPALGQLFGSGKTTLAYDFFSTLRSPELQEHSSRVALLERHGALFQKHAAKLDDFVTGASKWQELVDKVRWNVAPRVLQTHPEPAGGRRPLSSQCPLSVLLRELVTAVAKPVLFFFDDLHGGPQLVDLLCNQITDTYNELRNPAFAHLPFFGFLLAGRELGRLHLPQATSARLEWVLLQSYSAPDVRVIVQGLCDDRCPAFAGIKRLVSPQNIAQFAEMLREASGGIALLVYQVMLGVYYAWCEYSTDDLEYLFDTCFEALSRIRGKDSYFEIPQISDSPGLSAVFFLAVTQTPFAMDEKVPVLGSRQRTLVARKLLRELPVTVARHAADSDKFLVVMSGFQKRFLLSKRMIDLRMALLAPVAQCINAAKLAERVVVGTILLNCIASKEKTWGATLSWLGGTKAGSRSVPECVVGRVCPKFQDKSKYGKDFFAGKTCNIADELLSLPTFKSSDMGWFFEQMEEGYYIFHDESHSADALAYVRRGGPNLFVQLQVKEGEQEFTLRTLIDELGKTYTGSAAVLVVLSRSMGANLKALCQPGCLVLGPGVYFYNPTKGSLVRVRDNDLAVFTSGGGVRGEKKERQLKTTVLFRGSHYSLSDDVSKNTVASLEEELGRAAEAEVCHSRFVVESNLEVVVLHPDSYRSFLGETVFEDIAKIAAGGHENVDLLGMLSCPVLPRKKATARGLLPIGAIWTIL